MKTVTPVSIALVAVFVADLPPTSPLPDQAGQSRGLSHLDIHLAKEDAHFYRLVRERVSLPDQGKAVGVMAGTVPQERFPDLQGKDLVKVADDRIMVTRDGWKGPASGVRDRGILHIAAFQRGHPLVFRLGLDHLA